MYIGSTCLETLLLTHLLSSECEVFRQDDPVLGALHADVMAVAPGYFPVGDQLQVDRTWPACSIHIMPWGICAEESREPHYVIPRDPVSLVTFVIKIMILKLNHG